MTTDVTRRGVTLGAIGVIGIPTIASAVGKMRMSAPDLILVNGKFTTLDRENPEADAIAIRGGRFSHVGKRRAVEKLAGPETVRIDLQGRRVIPGLIDSHMHLIRGGLSYNMSHRAREWRFPETSSPAPAAHARLVSCPSLWRLPARAGVRRRARSGASHLRLRNGLQRPRPRSRQGVGFVGAGPAQPILGRPWLLLLRLINHKEKKYV